MKSVIQLEPLAGRVPVKRKRFAGFIKCLLKWLPNFIGSLFFMVKSFLYSLAKSSATS